MLWILTDSMAWGELHLNYVYRSKDDLLRWGNIHKNELKIWAYKNTEAICKAALLFFLPSRMAKLLDE